MFPLGTEFLFHFQVDTKRNICILKREEKKNLTSALDSKSGRLRKKNKVTKAFNSYKNSGNNLISKLSKI